MEQNKKRAVPTTYLLAMILLLYPLRHVLTGVDMMDAGYALGNYHFFDTMNETWKLATYLSNVVGMLLSKLPFGGTWIGMNVYTGMLVGLVAAATYLFLARQYGRKYLLFTAELVALSLCWAPTTVLYHYLGYLMMTIAVLVLYQAIVTDDIKKYIIAGVILGLCVAVRMPNITYMAFILPLWYYCLLKKREFHVLLKRTGCCVLGYIAGVIMPLGYICIRYGFSAYPAMVNALFGMTDTASDYKPAAMVMAMIGDYVRYSVWLVLFLVYMAAGEAFFILYDRLCIKKTCLVKARGLMRALYFAGFLVVVRFCYGRGMFDFDYTEGFSMYKWVTVYLLLVILLCVSLLFDKAAGTEDRLWAAFLLVIIFITPLGSNNVLYPIINNLFLVAPVSMHLLVNTAKNHAGIWRRIGGNAEFACRMVICGVLACVAVQSVLFGAYFVFHDNGNAADCALELPVSSPANGMRTSADKKGELEELAAYLAQEGLLDRKVILFGDVPALSYILDMEPAVFTTWADLDSNSALRLQEDLDRISMAKEPMPVVIYGTQAVSRLRIYETGGAGGDAGDVTRARKLGMIDRFMQENRYEACYTGENFTVYCHMEPDK